MDELYQTIMGLLLILAVMGILAGIFGDIPEPGTVSRHATMSKTLSSA